MDINSSYKSRSNLSQEYERASSSVIFCSGAQALTPSEINENKMKPIYYANEEVLSFRECLLMLIAQFIPIVGLCFTAYWAFEAKELTPKRTLARALLCLHLVVYFVLALVFLL